MTSRAWHPKNSRFDDTLLRCITFSGRKSGVGQSRGLADVRDTSVVAPIADIGADIDVGREVPIAAIAEPSGQWSTD
jgi:hypothetical protein